MRQQRIRHNYNTRKTIRTSELSERAKVKNVMTDMNKVEAEVLFK